MKVTSVKSPLARKTNGYIDSAVLNTIFDEVVSSTSDKIKAVHIIVSALNKIDMADSEWIELVEMEIIDLLTEAEISDITIIHVSAINETGIDELKKTIIELICF